MIVESLVGVALVALAAAVGLGVWRALGGPALGGWHGALRVAVVASLAVAVVAFGLWRFVNSRQLQLFGGLITRVETSEPAVALTFDDGPNPAYAQEILDILQAEGAKATFFVNGASLAADLTAARSIAAAGHELGNHTYSHKQMVGVSYDAVRSEIERTDDLIHAAGYDGEILFRAPYCKHLLVLPYYLRRNHRRSIVWDVEPESYPDVAADAGRIAEHVLAHTRPGSIILLHPWGEGRAETRRALPAIIRGLKARGYRPVTVSELVALESGRLPSPF